MSKLKATARTMKVTNGKTYPVSKRTVKVSK